MTSIMIFADSINMFGAFSKEAMGTFFEGLKVLALGMSTVIGVLIVFYLLIKLMIKIFPSKE